MFDICICGHPYFVFNKIHLVQILKTFLSFYMFRQNRYQKLDNRENNNRSPLVLKKFTSKHFVESDMIFNQQLKDTL